jgi:molybdopterin-guanine dinucleotide biosynthesis protein A
VDAWFSQVKLQLMRVEEIRRYDPKLLSFWNVNTPDELHQAELRAVEESSSLMGG